MNKRDFPYIATLVVPLNGFGHTLDHIEDWHRERKIRQHPGRGYRLEDYQIACWIFLDVNTAFSFHKQFGGAVQLSAQHLEPTHSRAAYRVAEVQSAAT